MDLFFDLQCLQQFVILHKVHASRCCCLYDRKNFKWTRDMCINVWVFACQSIGEIIRLNEWHINVHIGLHAIYIVYVWAYFSFYFVFSVVFVVSNLFTEYIAPIFDSQTLIGRGVTEKTKKTQRAFFLIRRDWNSREETHSFIRYNYKAKIFGWHLRRDLVRSCCFILVFVL